MTTFERKRRPLTLASGELLRRNHRTTARRLPYTLHRVTRTLLQADPQCSAAELLAVQADPVAAVTAMFTTTFDCAMCLVPCKSAADALDCAMGCLKQDEGG